MAEQPRAPVFPTIPLPENSVESLHRTCLALKKTVEMLTGGDSKSKDGTSSDRFATHCFVSGDPPQAIHAGDLWLCTNQNYSFSVWTGSSWLMIAALPPQGVSASPSAYSVQQVRIPPADAMSIVFGNIAPYGMQIAHAAGTGYSPSTDQVIARLTADGNLAGGFLYTHYTRVAITMHMAGFIPGWCTPTLLAIAFDYPFNQLGVERVFGTVPSTNHTALNQDMRGGWKEVTRIPDAVEGGDMIVLSMSRSECKWLRLGQRYIRLRPCERGIAA